MTTIRRLIAVLGVGAAMLGGAAAAASGQPPVTPADIAVFKEGGAYVLRTNDGLAIYTFARDEPGVSSCVDACAAAWPPVPAPADARAVADWTPIARPGGRQWAYRGKPVYTYARDTPGRETGDGVGGMWARVKP